MEFIKAIKIMKRMCAGGCHDCPLDDSNNNTKKSCDDFMRLHPEEAEKILIKWAEEHPQKTILQDFLEKYPNAPLYKTGIPKACPIDLGYYGSKCPLADSAVSCKECWNKPMED